jgi:hypothetical protein
MFSTCSHHVPNALKKKKLVSQLPIIFLQKWFPRGTKMLTKISHCFCPNLGRVDRSYFLCHKDHPILLLLVVVVVVVVVVVLVLVLYLAMIVPQFPIVFLQKMVPKRHQNFNKNIPLLLPKLGKGE